MIRFAILGTGESAEKFYQANRFARGFELAAVYDIEMDRVKEFCFRKGQPAAYDDLAALADDNRVDAAYISGPAGSHYEQAVALLNAGKHVLCQSPLAGDSREAEEMYRIAEEKGLVLLEAATSRYTPGFKEMTRYVNTMGKIRYACFQNSCHLREYESYKKGLVRGVFDQENSGGALRVMAAGPVASMVEMFGAPDKVSAFGVTLDSGVNAAGTIIMNYEDMIGEVQYSVITDSVVPSQIQGEEASMMIKDIELVKDLKIRRGSVNQVIHFDQSDNAFNHVTETFINMVADGVCDRTGSEKAAAESKTSYDRCRENSLSVVNILEEAARQLIGRDEE